MKKLLVFLRFSPFLFWQVALFLFLPPAVKAQKAEPGYVILVSFDGFRYDYVEKYNAPNFKAFIKAGASAAGLIPSFPSKTFPNHYTIVTGMYPGHHGLVDNTFFDKKRGQTYSISNRVLVQDPVYYGGLPLWQLAQQHGLKTASYFWVGSEAPIQGSYPSYHYVYDEKTTNETRVDQAIHWLQLPDSLRPHFITLYFSLVDDAGHDFGPNAPELGQEVLAADQILGRLMAGVDSLPLPVNVLLCSDHGMLEMQSVKETYILADELPGYSDPALTWINNGTHIQIYCPDSLRQRSLKQELLQHRQHFRVWAQADFPGRWHYQNERVGDLFLLADPGFYFSRSSSVYWKKLQAGEQLPAWGTHGFDPGFSREMQGIFYAKGPQIRPGMRLPPVENIHIYPLIAQLLGLPIPENIDGKAKVLNGLLQKN